MLQLTRKGLLHQGNLDALRDRFAANHCVVLEKLLEPALLEKVQRQIDEASWHSSAFDDFGGSEDTLDAPVTVRLLLFLLNSPGFLNAIRIVTGYAQISDFDGRVYRLAASRQHHLSWHTDTNDPTRQVGFSMNLSTEAFHGGTFELRDRWTLAPLVQVNNAGFGDALVFRISKNLQHRVTRVVDTVAKTACAGWFHARDVSFFAELVGQSKSQALQ